MRTRIIEKELENLEPYLHRRFSTPLRYFIVAQSVRLSESSIRLSAEGLLKKLLVYTEDESSL